MRGLRWAMGFAVVFPIACILPPTQPTQPTLAASRPAVPREADVTALLAQGRRASDAEHYEEARDLARRGLALTKQVHVPLRTMADLHRLEAHALFMLNDTECQQAFEAVLRIYEKIPGAERDVVSASEDLAMSLIGPVMDLERAEALLERTFDLASRFAPDYDLVFAHWMLLELFHQECRTADALPLLEKVDALVKSQSPVEPTRVQTLCRMRANFAANQGDIAGAIAWEKRGLDELTRAESKEDVTGLRDVAYSVLADLERDRGNYVESRGYVERRMELAAKRRIGDFERALLAEELHWAYRASADPRLAEHDAKHGFVSAHAGEPLFPAKLPEQGACHPEAAKPPRGALHRYSAVSERADGCFLDSKRPEGERIPIHLRVVGGKVVAVEVLGRRTEPSVLRCIADAALGYEHPTEKYNEFGYESLQ